MIMYTARFVQTIRSSKVKLVIVVGSKHMKKGYAFITSHLFATGAWGWMGLEISYFPDPLPGYHELIRSRVHTYYVHTVHR